MGFHSLMSLKKERNNISWEEWGHYQTPETTKLFLLSAISSSLPVLWHLTNASDSSLVSLWPTVHPMRGLIRQV